MKVSLTVRDSLISRTQRILDNDADYVQPPDMLAELRDDNKTLASTLREAHNVCDEYRRACAANYGGHD
jgi:DNA-binding ferritin-like protein